MDNPHKPRALVAEDRTRRIFGDHPAYFIYFPFDRVNHRSFNRALPPGVAEWLTEHIGEEWIDWAGTVMLCSQYRDVVALAFRDENKALYAALNFGKIDIDIQ